MTEVPELLTIKEASEWATEKLGKNVTRSNISYLIQYGLIKKLGEKRSARVAKKELSDYYTAYHENRRFSWKDRLGDDIHWALSFDQYKEAETTKHVHRLHPYKGKFIPQLVEYFLDGHTDEIKKHVSAKKGDLILDPFCGSGTTLVQSAELGMHAIGIDISTFNTLISNGKLSRYDLSELRMEIDRLSRTLKKFQFNSLTLGFEEKLLKILGEFNNLYFPVPDYKYQIRQGGIDEFKYGREKELQFLPIYEKLVKEYNLILRQGKDESFLDTWFLQPVRQEIQFLSNAVGKIKGSEIRNIINIILSRTIRSCRSTTHADLATLVEPVTTTYYCSKHGKICKPLFSILRKWQEYSRDTIKRLEEFNQKRTDTFQICLSGDSRTIDIFNELERKNTAFAKLLNRKGINTIFSSPPYVGMIDYHEQHAYAYDLFGFERNDELEIGPLFKGKGRDARQSYIIGISNVLKNCTKYLATQYTVFLVANDKYNLYPSIAENAGMQIVNQYKRPVLNRTEKDKGAYSETIFQLKHS